MFYLHIFSLAQRLGVPSRRACGASETRGHVKPSCLWPPSKGLLDSNCSYVERIVTRSFVKVGYANAGWNFLISWLRG